MELRVTLSVVDDRLASNTTDTFELNDVFCKVTLEFDVTNIFAEDDKVDTGRVVFVVAIISTRDVEDSVAVGRVKLVVPVTVGKKLLVVIDAAEPTRKSTSEVLLPPAPVISHSASTNKYWSVRSYEPADHVTVLVCSALVVRLVTVVPVWTEPVNSVALDPLALADFHTRIRIRPSCEPPLLTAMTGKLNVHVPDSNVPEIVFCDRQASPLLGPVLLFSEDVVEKLPDDSSVA